MAPAVEVPEESAQAAAVVGVFPVEGQEVIVDIELTGEHRRQAGIRRLF